MRKHGGIYVITSFNPDSGEACFNPVAVKDIHQVPPIIREQMMMIANDLGEEPDPSDLLNCILEEWEDVELNPNSDNNTWEYESDVDNTTWTVTCVNLQ